MHITHQLIGQIAGVIAFLSIWPYVISILKGHTKPSRSAYAIWALVEVVTAVTYIASGARSTIWVILTWAFSAVLIFILSIKYGMGGHSKLDLTCLAIALIAITIWITTKSPIAALYASIIAGKLSYLPIIKKSYLTPETENTLSWGMVVFAAILNLFALTTLRPAISILPISGAIIEGTVFILLILPRQRKLNR
jgi:hypothetical protein